MTTHLSCSCRLREEVFAHSHAQEVLLGEGELGFPALSLAVTALRDTSGHACCRRLLQKLHATFAIEHDF
jgi:hypothetical protein